MAHNDHTPIPQQRQDSPTPAPGPRAARLAGLRQWWDDAWSDGGVLHARWEDLRHAPELGWHQMANWLKTLLTIVGLSLAVLLLDAAAGALADAIHHLLTAAPRVQIGTDTSTGVWAVLDQPIRTYIAQHSTGLAISGSTTYTLWQVAGLFGLIGGFLHSTAARLTWTAWGAASTAMVWSAAPADSRTLAAGITALAWTAASAFALRGLSLRPAVFVHTVAPKVRNEIRPQVNVPAPADPPDDAPDNVHQLR